MLLYANGSSGRQLFQSFGSAVYKLDVLVVGAIVAAATAALQYIHDQQEEIAIPHQYAMHVFGGIVTIGLAFRTNQAWLRYWDGIHQLHVMYSKWADAYSQFCGFVGVTIQRTYEKGEDGAKEKEAWLREMQAKVENDFLLLSAMACDRLVRGDCARMQRKSELKLPWAERIVMREDLRKGTDLTNAKGMPKFCIPKFRGVDQCISYASCKSVDFDGLNVQGGWSAEYLIHKIPSGRKLDLLAGSADRANMVVNWLNHNLSYCGSELAPPAPIQSRMYQEISNGMVGFNSAVKIADVPYPFPHSQIMLMLLICFICALPVYVMSFTQSMIAGPSLAFFIATFLISMNDIAQQLENPYGQGANQVCVPEFHSRFLLVAREASISSRSPPSPPKKSSIEERVRTQSENRQSVNSLSSRSFELEPIDLERGAKNTRVSFAGDVFKEEQEAPSPKEEVPLSKEDRMDQEMDDKLLQKVSSSKEDSIDQDDMETRTQEELVTKTQDIVSTARLYSQLGMGTSEMELILQQLARTHALMEQHLSILSQQLRCLSNSASIPSEFSESEMIRAFSRPHSYAFQTTAYLPRTDQKPGQQSVHQASDKTRLPGAGAQARSSQTISAFILEGCKGSCVAESYNGVSGERRGTDEIDGMAPRLRL